VDTSVSRPVARKADGFVESIARHAQERTIKPSQWRRPTTASAISIFIHLLLLLFLVLFTKVRNTANLAESITIEVDPNAVMSLFDSFDAGFDTNQPLVAKLEQPPVNEAPLKISPAQDMPNVSALDPGSAVSSMAPGDAGLQMGNGSAGGGGSTSGTSPVGSAGLFGLTAKAKRVVFVIDRSSSMKKNDAFEFAKDELIRSIGNLQSNMEFQIVLYSDGIDTLQHPDRKRDMILGTEVNRERAMREIRQWEAAGGTNHHKALDRAYDFKPDAIFLLTDAEDTPEDIQLLISHVNKLNRNRAKSLEPVSIHLIQFWHDENKEPSPLVRQLPELNRGSYAIIYTYKDRRRSNR
jgi:hypothetical protein